MQLIQRLFLLFCELAEEDVLGVAAGTRNGTSLKGICQIRITQGFQIAAAAAGPAGALPAGGALGRGLPLCACRVGCAAAVFAVAAVATGGLRWGRGCGSDGGRGRVRCEAISCC